MFDRGFKRLNFFEGFVTTPDDWNDGEKFHVEKHRGWLWHEVIVHENRQARRGWEARVVVIFEVHGPA